MTGLGSIAEMRLGGDCPGEGWVGAGASPSRASPRSAADLVERVVEDDVDVVAQAEPGGGVGVLLDQLEVLVAVELDLDGLQVLFGLGGGVVPGVAVLVEGAAVDDPGLLGVIAGDL